MVWDALKGLRLEKPTARRLKTVYSIEEKLKRQRTRLTQIQDIAGIRLTCRDAPDQDLESRIGGRKFPRGLPSTSVRPSSTVEGHNGSKMLSLGILKP